MSAEFLTKAGRLGLAIRENIPLAPYTTWKIGGPAKFFCAVKTVERTEQLLAIATEFGVPFRVIGGGSNILVADRGYDGLIVRMEIDGLRKEDSRVVAGAGVAMGRLAAYALQQGLGGLEWAVGIPGTVGGAVFGNSNCFGGSTGRSLLAAVLLDQSGKVRSVNREYFNFSYDFSRIQTTGEIVLEATFAATPLDDQQLQKLREGIARVAAVRASSQPLGEKCAGSTFKALVVTPEVETILNRRLPEWRRQGIRDGFVSAGYIIEHGLHLKGFQMERMKISDLHANFFINLGEATAKNARQLIDFVKVKCHNELGLALEEEIKYTGNF